MPIPAPAVRIEGAGKMRLGVSAGLALLVVASLTNQAVVNLPPVVIGGKLVASPELATAIGASIMLTRLPMFAFVPLQTMLLPRLTETAAKGDRAGVRRQTVRTVAVCVVLGMLGIALLGTVGPQLLELYLGRPTELSHATMAGLGIGTLFLMTANVTQPALLALGRHRAVLTAYLSGAAAMVVAFVLPVDAVTSAVLSAAAGPIVVAIVMAITLKTATGETPEPSTTATSEQTIPR
jgi:O-antigen/teichoic acid export membrane protein